jgi:hypothetical protein
MSYSLRVYAWPACLGEKPANRLEQAYRTGARGGQQLVQRSS